MWQWLIITKKIYLCTMWMFVNNTQCVPGIFNLNQKFHGLSCFWGLYIHKTFQNQSLKTSVIRLPKHTTVNMARECPQRASFSKENLFLSITVVENLMTDGFLDWFWILLHVWNLQKQESPWNFWSRLKIPGAHCDFWYT